jgi:hypothetical protein
MQVADIPNIDWVLIGAAFKSLTNAKKRRVTKHASGHFGCGKMMKIWKFQDHSKCPRCPEPYEDPQHILCCPAPSARARWITAVTKLKSWLTKNHTMPELTTVIIRSLHLWPNPRNNPPTLHSTTKRYGLQKAMFEQNTIGWYNFLMGRISVRWQHVQQQYFEWLKRRNTGKAWATALLKKVWEVSWDLWDHRNEVRLSTLSPTNRKIIEDLNAQISVEFATGTTGLGHRDHHWLEKPLAHVIGYDKDHKAQWLASIDLARARFTNRREFAASSLRQQRETMENWLAQLRLHTPTTINQGQQGEASLAGA